MNQVDRLETNRYNTEQKKIEKTEKVLNQLESYGQEKHEMVA